ncbi:MAG: HAMP domain-containing sensor histidine kinase, partial [Anaerolineae bacterium]|nr:HAMP domain-containing sensor histidine kinase [Anaerolineae bacterium]
PPEAVWVNKPKEGQLPTGVSHQTFHSDAIGTEIGFCVYLPPGYETETELIDPRDGKQRVMRAHTSLVDDHENQPLGTVTIIQDVTAVREVNRLKTEFLTTAAHEFRTPLTSVQGFSEILLTRDLEKERQQQYLRMINKQATHLAEIVDDLLDVARLEAKRGLEIKPKPLNIAGLFEEVLLPFIETERQHDFHLVKMDNLPCVIGDPFRIAQVAKNLISNAIKYSPQGGKVTIAGQATGNTVTISIHDEGIGMTPEQQEHLFEKFYRADASNTSISGTGLGLAICKLIVELHDGEIWAESEYGIGSTLYFTIPVAK